MGFERGICGAAANESIEPGIAWRGVGSVRIISKRLLRGIRRSGLSGRQAPRFLD